MNGDHRTGGCPASKVLVVAAIADKGKPSNCPWRSWMSHRHTVMTGPHDGGASPGFLPRYKMLAIGGYKNFGIFSTNARTSAGSSISAEGSFKTPRCQINYSLDSTEVNAADRGNWDLIFGASAPLDPCRCIRLHRPPSPLLVTITPLQAVAPGCRNDPCFCFSS